ncbi:MAG: hypothetical protein HY910_18060 [Desulfarculus sp.]|nr:hypothetical protein [Desulfarculus sp.]
MLSARMLRLAGWSALGTIILAFLVLSGLIYFKVNELVHRDMAEWFRDDYGRLPLMVFIISASILEYLMMLFQLYVIRNYYKLRLRYSKYDILLLLACLLAFISTLLYVRHILDGSGLESPAPYTVIISCVVALLGGIWLLLVPGNMFKLKKPLAWTCILYGVLSVVIYLEVVGLVFGLVHYILLVKFFFRAAKNEEWLATQQQTT